MVLFLGVWQSPVSAAGLVAQFVPARYIHLQSQCTWWLLLDSFNWICGVSVLGDCSHAVFSPGDPPVFTLYSVDGTIVQSHGSLSIGGKSYSVSWIQEPVPMPWIRKQMLAVDLVPPNYYFRSVFLGAHPFNRRVLRHLQSSKRIRCMLLYCTFYLLSHFHIRFPVPTNRDDFNPGWYHDIPYSI